MENAVTCGYYVAYGNIVDLARGLTIEKAMKKISLTIALLMIAMLSAIPAEIIADSTPSDSTPVLKGDGLNDYLNYAEASNPAVKAAFYSWKAKERQISIDHSLPDPQLSYTNMFENGGTFTDFEKEKFGLSQMFPWFGTLGARKDVASGAAAAAYNKYEAEKLKVFYMVKAAYYSYYLLGREISITQDNFDLLTFWEKVLRARYAASMASQPDLIKVQVELGNLENNLTSLHAKQTVAESSLRAVLNLPDSVRLPFPDTVENFEAPIEASSIRADAFASNPDLQSMQNMIASAKASINVASKESYPSFMLGAMYTKQPAMGSIKMYPWEVNVGVSLPIWFGRNKAKREKARAMFNSAQESYADSRNQLSAYVDKVVFEYQDADRRRQLYGTGLIPKAQQALDVTYASYQADNTDFLSLLDAERQLLNFQLAYETSLATQATKLAEIEMLTGKEQLTQ
ncbi:MAG TPA: TolC family protein [candidate division Zixibacteria bacterium]|nr:TolC family protein [candidate division Zixibacteria bacterium]